jgi:ribosomal protein L11 methyltransferase
VAAKLGASAIVATDIDPIAVDVTRENVEIHGLTLAPAGLIDVRQASVPAGMAGRFQVVVANILAEVIAGLFDGAYENVPLLEPLAPNGTMILSGIIEERAFLVEEAAARHGMAVVRREQEGDWVALFVQRMKDEG